MSTPGAGPSAEVAALSEDLIARLFLASPYFASEMGVPGYDALVPDESHDGDRAQRADLKALDARAGAVDTGSLSPAERLTLRCVQEAIATQVATIDVAAPDYAVSAMPFEGPPILLAVTARTQLADADRAADYLTRLQAGAGWIDQRTDRLRDGAARGRLPVAALLEQAIGWVDARTAEGVPAALTAPEPPSDWSGADGWRAELERLAGEVVLPALQRWREAMVELRPRARDDSRAGLSWIPGGEADYAKLIRVHTTLDVTADQLHLTGLNAVEQLEARMLELGAPLGLTDLAIVHAQFAEAATPDDPMAALADAVRAVRRAEAAAVDVFGAPLVPPCAVTPMPVTVGEAGTAPHYTSPAKDGSRPGTFWFNTVRPTAGCGWDLEAIAYHEAVPGHHLQASRAQLLDALPAVQRDLFVTAHGEGWGLYSEQLADELGLYSDVRQQMGAVAASLMRAARLVVDTGLHAKGWSRGQALDYFVAHVPMPPTFLANEIDRYLTMPGQALAYHTGKAEILRLREQAREVLGERFTLSGFHVAVVDNGSVPLPVLADAVGAWVAAGG